MTDPLDALAAPIVPVDPDPAFAARLRVGSNASSHWQKRPAEQNENEQDTTVPDETRQHERRRNR